MSFSFLLFSFRHTYSVVFHRTFHRKPLRMVVWFAGIILSLLAMNLHAETLTASWEPWPPYQFENGGQLTGLDIDLVEAILKEAGLSPKFVKRPWKRQLQEAEEGTIDVVPGASKTPEREQFALFSNAYRTEAVVMLVSRENAEKFASMTSILAMLKNNLKIGVVREYYYGEDYAALAKDSQYSAGFKEVGDEATNFKKLMTGRIDAMLVDPVAASAAIAENGWQGKLATLFTVYADDIYLLFSKRSVTPSRVEQINEALQRLKDNGQHAAIVSRYLKQ